MKIIVTSYEEPDLDGISCMYAYAEYLNKIGKDSDYYICGIPNREVDIVCEMFNIKLEGTNNITEEQEVVIVDTNKMEGIPFVNPKNVIEIIDHHSKSSTSDECIRAKIQIERVGAAATLVAEKFKNNNISISREAAILLYYGIVSNSINLKATITTKKDIEMVNWLKEKCAEIDEEKIKIIFERKSKIEDENLRKEIEAENIITYKENKAAVGQLEIVNVEMFLNEKKEKLIQIMKDIKLEYKLNYIFINCIDILEGFNIILALDKETESELNKVFGYKFENEICKLNKVVQRKEITKALRENNI